MLPTPYTHQAQHITFEMLLSAHLTRPRLSHNCQKWLAEWVDSPRNFLHTERLLPRNFLHTERLLPPRRETFVTGQCSEFCRLSFCHTSGGFVWETCTHINLNTQFSTTPDNSIYYEKKTQLCAFKPYRSLTVSGIKKSKSDTFRLIIQQVIATIIANYSVPCTPVCGMSLQSAWSWLPHKKNTYWGAAMSGILSGCHVRHAEELPCQAYWGAAVSGILRSFYARHTEELLQSMPDK